MDGRARVRRLLSGLLRRAWLGSVDEGSPDRPPWVGLSPTDLADIARYRANCRLRRRGRRDEPALRDRRAELRSLQGLRRQGPGRGHHLDDPGRRRRSDLRGNVAGGHRRRLELSLGRSVSMDDRTRRDLAEAPSFAFSRNGPHPERRRPAGHRQRSRRGGGPSTGGASDLRGAAGAKIGDSSAFIRDVAERSVEAGPALRFDLVLKPGADFLLPPP